MPFLVRSLFFLVALSLLPFDVFSAQRQKDQLQSNIPTFEVVKGDLEGVYCKCILEDAEGYLWFGTRNGVYRFDGIASKHIISSDQEPSIASAPVSVSSFYDDTLSNCIWVTVEDTNRIIKIDKKNYKPQELHLDLPSELNANSKQGHVIVAVHNVSDKLMLAATARKVFLVDKQTLKAIKHYDVAMKHLTLTTRFVDVGRRTFMIYGFRLYEVRIGPSGDVSFEDLDLGELSVRRVSAYGDSTLVIEQLKDNTSLTYLSLNVNTMRCDSITNVSFMTRNFAVTDDGLWLTTVQGLFFYRFSDKCLLNYSTGNSQILDNKLSDVLKLKRQPILYIGSNDGIIKLNYYLSKFNLTDMRRYSTSTTSDVRRIYKDSRGNYWAWCVDGLFYREANKVLFTRWENDFFDFRKEYGRQILETEDKECVYLLTTFNLFKCSHDAKKLVALFPKGNRVRFNSMQFADKDNLVITTLEGYVLYNLKSRKTEIVNLSPKIGSILTGRLSDSGKLWVATVDCKVYEVDLKTGRVGKPLELSKEVGRINCMRYYSENGLRELWIGTSRHGLYYYAPDAKAVRRITNSSFISFQVSSMELDSKGNLWVGSDKGIVCMSEGMTTEFSNRNFSIANKINVEASSISQTGDILMGGVNSFVEFDTEKFFQNDYFPAPRVASYYLANAVNHYYDGFTGEEYLFGQDTIVVPAGIRSLRLFVRELNYDRPLDNRIQWQLAEDGDEWHDTRTVAGITLTNITGGTHQLRLRTIDSRGDIRPDIKTVWLVKELFFYESWLFRIGMVGFVLALVSGLMYRRHRRNEKLRQKLESEVMRQTGIIRRNNDELRHSQSIIKEQYLTIKRHKDELEETVALRTAELNAAKIKAEETSQLKSNFLASLSHEVRTPMNAIVGFAKLLTEEQCPNEERIEFARMILESSSSMLSLIGDLLDTSRIERGILPIAIEPFDVYQVLSDVFSMLSVEKRNPNVKFKLVIDDTLKGLTLESDKQRIRQVVINLVYNAFKFTAKGHVSVLAWYVKSGGQMLPCHYPSSMPPPPSCPLLLISVQDTGIGIPQEKQEEIFEPFRRLTTNNIRYSGLGLGLNIVRNIVLLLGGKVWVHSQPNVGSEFYIYLPFDKSLLPQQQSSK